MAVVKALCISSQRQQPKIEVEQALFVHGGIEGDSHKDFTEREISLLRAEDIHKAALEAGFDFPPGALAENLIIEGLPQELPIGGFLTIGDSVELEILEKGKKADEPHSYDYRGYCLLPLVGYFLRVSREGRVKKGDEVSLVGPGRPDS